MVHIVYSLLVKGYKERCLPPVSNSPLSPFAPTSKPVSPHAKVVPLPSASKQTLPRGVFCKTPTHQLDDKNGNAKWMHKTTTGIHSLTTGVIFCRKVYKYGPSKFSRRFTTIGYRFHPFEGEVSFSSFFPTNLESRPFVNLESHPFVVVCTIFIHFFSFGAVLWDQLYNSTSKPCWTNMPPSTSWQNSFPPCSVVPQIDPKHPRWIDSDVVLDWKFALDLSFGCDSMAAPDLGNLQFFPGKSVLLGNTRNPKQLKPAIDLWILENDYMHLWCLICHMSVS